MEGQSNLQGDKVESLTVEGSDKVVAIEPSAKVEKLPEPREVRAEISLTLYMDGSYQVNGPFDDMLLYYGMLGLAQHAAFQHMAQEHERRMREAVAMRSATNPNKKPGLFDRFRVAREARAAAERSRKAREDEQRRVAAQERLQQSAGSPGTGEEQPNKTT